MPLYNFQKQFADDVESRKKRQTIRARRKTRPKVGQTAFLYTGARTKACRKLGDAEIKAVYEVWIGQSGVLLGGQGSFMLQHLDTFAQADGFDGWHSMRDWFKKNHGLPFEGDLIQW